MKTFTGKVLITSEVEITKLDEYQISMLRKGTAWGWTKSHAENA
ncbi:hypothetical protein [Spirosoma aerolatum]|nr:hypothetical protein [Spirosoma aerolatum]